MVSMVGKSIRKWWALFTLPTLAAFIVGFFGTICHRRLFELLRIHYGV